MQAAAQQSTINPAFAGHLAEQLREATGDLHSVFDNLRDIASGDRPNANTYDRLRATRILLDRGFGKVTKPESTEGGPWGQPLKKREGAPMNLG